MKIYQTNCASCHGDVQKSNGMFAGTLYRVRLSGMPAWKQILNDQQVWQVTAFLSHMGKLPSEVAARWKVLAAARRN